MRNEEQFVLRCEEVFHDKISSAAATILASKDKKPIVALTGPLRPGKTTTAMRLQQYLQSLGVKVCMLSMDNFFLPLDQRPPEATDWESPYCVNRDLLVDCIHRLADGQEVEGALVRFRHRQNRRLAQDAGRQGCHHHRRGHPHAQSPDL